MGDRMSEPAKGGRDWDAIERDFRAGIPMAALLKKHELSVGAFYSHADRYGWPRRKILRPANPEDIHKHTKVLREIVGKVMDEMRILPEAPLDTARIGEHVRLLKQLQGALEKFSNLSKKEAAAGRIAQHPRLVTDARRAEIARRLEGLCRQLRSERDCPPSA